MRSTSNWARKRQILEQTRRGITYSTFAPMDAPRARLYTGDSRLGHWQWGSSPEALDPSSHIVTKDAIRVVKTLV